MKTSTAFETALSLAKQGVKVKLHRISKGVWGVSIVGDGK